MNKDILSNNLNDKVSYEDFFHAFGYTNDDEVFLRFFYDKSDKETDYEQSRAGEAGNVTVKLRYLGNEMSRLRYLNSKQDGIFFSVNGAKNDKSVTRIRAQFVESDEGTFEEQIQRIANYPQEPSIIIKTRKSLHCYWLLEGAPEVRRFEYIQLQLVAQFNGDRACKNLSRVMRLYGFDHCKKDPVRVQLLKFDPDTRYTQEELSSLLLPPQEDSKNKTIQAGENVGGFLGTGLSAPPDYRQDLRFVKRDKSIEWFEKFCIDHHINVLESAELVDGTAAFSVECPHKERHTTATKKNDSVVMIYPSGRYMYNCFHSSCGVTNWKDYRNFYDPEEERAAIDEGWNKQKAAEASAQAPAHAPAGVNDIPDDELLRRIRASKSSEVFDSLWNFQRTDPEIHIQDFALLDILAFWTANNPERMERIYQHSPLYDPKWWNENREGILNNILESRKGKPVYEPKPGSGIPASQETAPPPALLPKESDSIGYYFDNLMAEEWDNFKPALKTGFQSFDRQLGGLYVGLYVIGAISSLGKTTFCHQVGDQIAASGHKVLYFSLEQSRLELATKSIARIMARKKSAFPMSSIDIRARRFMSPEQIEAVAEASAQYRRESGDNMLIIECPIDSSRMGDISGYIDAYCKQDPDSHPVVILDYLQILRPSAGDERASQKEIVDHSITALKKLSTKYGLTIIAISSVNRSNYLVPVSFEALKESGNIEYGADCVLGIDMQCLEEKTFTDGGKDSKIIEKRNRMEEAINETPRKVRVTCLKSRFGRRKVDLPFDYYSANDLFVEGETIDEKAKEHFSKSRGKKSQPVNDNPFTFDDDVEELMSRY